MSRSRLLTVAGATALLGAVLVAQPAAAHPAPRITRELLRYLDTDAWVSDWTRSHANFFRAVEIEKRMMFLILLLIVAVAAFNIVSTLTMVVTDKTREIGILKAMGMTARSIRGAATSCTG